jgi:hypothetical protein
MHSAFLAVHQIRAHYVFYLQGIVRVLSIYKL